MIDTILFDMGGTIEDIQYNKERERLTRNLVISKLKDAGQVISISKEEFWSQLLENRKKYKKVCGISEIELKPIQIWNDYYFKGFGFDAEAVARIAEDLAGMWEVTYFIRKLRPNVIEMLEKLKTRGYKLGVISNTMSLYSVFDVLEGYKIRDYFQDVTLSSVTGLRKPNADIFEISLRQMQSKAGNSMYVGDTISRDVIGSKRHGFAAAVQIKSFLTIGSDVDISSNEITPDFIITDMIEILDIVEKLNT